MSYLTEIKWYASKLKSLIVTYNWYQICCTFLNFGTHWEEMWTTVNFHEPEKNEQILRLNKKHMLT